MRHTFQFVYKEFSSFFAEIWQDLPDIVAKKNRAGELLFLASFESYEYLSRGNAYFIKT